MGAVFYHFVLVGVSFELREIRECVMADGPGGGGAPPQSRRTSVVGVTGHHGNISWCYELTTCFSLFCFLCFVVIVGLCLYICSWQQTVGVIV